jgi:hypothetical protein
MLSTPGTERALALGGSRLSVGEGVSAKEEFTRETKTSKTGMKSIVSFTSAPLECKPRIKRMDDHLSIDHVESKKKDTEDA